MRPPLILGIESSCDDTSAAVLSGSRVLANVTANQEVHRQYGGVVPELASRAHMSHILPVVHQALAQAQCRLEDLELIACTRGPGLLGSLLVGSSFAKGLSLALNLPLIDVHHMEAHVLAHFIEDAEIHGKNPPDFPFLSLTVSGGHTQLVLVHSPTRLELLGQTLDDAAGEAFDKAAKLLGLPYPGGPEIDRLAAQGRPGNHRFPVPKAGPLHFSFSGLKTSLYQYLQKQEVVPEGQALADLARDYQDAIIATLWKGLQEAVEATGVHRVVLAGGVSANKGLRTFLLEACTEKGWELHIPKLAYCTDNAAMIAMAGLMKYQSGAKGALDWTAQARMPMS